MSCLRTHNPGAYCTPCVGEREAVGKRMGGSSCCVNRAIEVDIDPLGFSE